MVRQRLMILTPCGQSFQDDQGISINVMIDVMIDKEEPVQERWVRARGQWVELREGWGVEMGQEMG